MHRYVARLRWVLVGALVAVALVGCGGEAGEGKDKDDKGGATTGTVDVTLTEWSVKASTAKAKAGEVTFKVANKGATVHELAVARTDLAADKLPQASGAVDEKQVPAIGRTANLDGGKSETKAFNLQAGKYVLYCNIPAHYGQGMYTAFTVE